MQDNISKERRQPSSDFASPKQIWILGAGYFGSIAAQRLSQRYSHTSFLVIDSQMEKLHQIRGKFALPTHTEEALSFLGKNPIKDDIWIIPAIPLHVAFLWVMDQLNRIGKTRTIPVPRDVDEQIPNAYRTTRGTVYSSFATFQCPDACNEPEDICTFTKEPRLGNLFEKLNQIRAPGFHTVVLRSRQLAPGVGGYMGGHLHEILERILSEAGNYLIATSCRCHGVIDALEWQKSV